jgi:hypothetical protein
MLKTVDKKIKKIPQSKFFYLTPILTPILYQRYVSEICMIYRIGVKKKTWAAEPKF